MRSWIRVSTTHSAPARHGCPSAGQAGAGMVGETGQAVEQRELFGGVVEGSGSRPGAFAPSRLLRLARRKPLGVAALVVLVAIWALCLLAPLIAPYGYDQLFTAPRLLAPSSAHLLGTDESGRDVL